MESKGDEPRWEKKELRWLFEDKVPRTRDFKLSTVIEQAGGFIKPRGRRVLL